jgi:hypothetical protein
MSLTWKRAILALIVAVATGCSGGVFPGGPAVKASGQMLVGRWSMVPKGIDDENPGVQEVSGAAGESARFRLVFNSDQTYEQSVETKIALAPVLNQKGSIKGTWKVVEARDNTLIIELPDGDLRPQVKIRFQSKDRCVYDQGEGEGEVLVLTRLP